MIITSLLDTDLYKFNMMQVVHNQFPNVPVRYKFKCRNPKIINFHRILEKLKSEINSLCELKFEPVELEYLESLRFIKRGFIDFLRGFKFNEKYITLESKMNGELDLYIEGPWLHTILFEVPLLAIISEIGMKVQMEELEIKKIPIYEELSSSLYKDIELLNKSKFKFIDFGTRRRFSKKWHKEALTNTLKHTNNLIGTSNVLFAKELNITPIGTQAHEYFQAMQGIYHPKISQEKALEHWVKEFEGDLGIALTDCINMDNFLKTFNLANTILYNGCRHDSGDPYVWCNKLIDHYKKYGIEPKTKTAVFSDGLNFKECNNLYEEFNDKINVSFGVGTYFTNNKNLLTPLNNVIKMIECNELPVAKISDSPGKGMCESENYVKYLKEIFNIKE